MLAEIRRRGLRPDRSVYVFMDANRPRPREGDDLRLTVEISIRKEDVIEQLDFWPLRNLDVAFCGCREMNDRVRAVLKAIVGAKPRFLAGAVADEQRLFCWSPERGWESDRVA